MSKFVYRKGRGLLNRITLCVRYIGSGLLGTMKERLTTSKLLSSVTLPTVS